MKWLAWLLVVDIVLTIVEFITKKVRVKIVCRPKTVRTKIVRGPKLAPA